MTTRTISETVQPPPNVFTDSFERGPDPWHADAFKGTGFESAGTVGERRMGWYYIDWCGNVVGWVPDGTVMEEKETPLPVIVVIAEGLPTTVEG